MSEYRESKNAALRRAELTALSTIRDAVAERGYPPSRREITEACGYHSTHDGQRILMRLVDQGLVKVAPHTPRGITITETGLKALTEDV